MEVQEKSVEKEVVLEIVMFGDEFLRQKADVVLSVTEDTRHLISGMVSTMKHYGGAGISAPQVGEALRIISIGIDLDTNERTDKVVSIINPEIVETDATQTCNEACLSIPMVSAKVNRPKWVKVKGLDESGQEIVVTGTELGASVLCHEIDHLDGILFTDHLRGVAKDVAIRKARKFSRMYNRIPRK